MKMLRHNLQPSSNDLQVYSHFKVNLWLDRVLLIINVYIPTAIALILIFHQVISQQVNCLLPGKASAQQENFVNQHCALQVGTNLLQGFAHNHMEDIEGSLQHAVFPPILLFLAFLHWLPHVWWRNTAGNVARRQLTMVKNELQCFREQTMRELNRRGIDSEMNIVDFSASVSELPLLQTTRLDWTLNAYLSSWQESNHLFKNYVIKHGVLLVLESVICLITFVVICAYKGAPFAFYFQCLLPPKIYVGYKSQCVMNSSLLLNINVIALFLMNVAGLLAQGVTYYFHFNQSRIMFKETDFMNDGFFTPYLKLLAYSLFKSDVHRVKTIHFNCLPGFMRSDFHFMNLLCIENVSLLTDSLYVHFWVDRFLREMKQRDCAASVSNNISFSSAAASRGRTCGMMKSEDCSFRLGFTKLKMKIELNDLFF